MTHDERMLMSAAAMCVMLVFESILLGTSWHTFLSERKTRFQLGLHEMWTCGLVAAAALFMLVELWHINQRTLMMVCFGVVTFGSMALGIGAILLFHRRRYSNPDVVDAPLMVALGGILGAYQMLAFVAVAQWTLRVL